MCKDCANCTWRVVMSFCDGVHTDPHREMCHYNWKECAKVRPDECKFKAKRTTEREVKE